MEQNLLKNYVILDRLHDLANMSQGEAFRAIIDCIIRIEKYEEDFNPYTNTYE